MKTDACRKKLNTITDIQENMLRDEQVCVTYCTDYVGEDRTKH
jgi:hypothetical protein